MKRWPTANTATSQKLSDDQIHRRLRDSLVRRSSELAIRHLGCSLAELKLHLESLFEPGMAWNSYGTHGWQIDHVVPLASAQDYHKRIALHHYRNLRPLWAKHNQSKGSRVGWIQSECSGLATAHARETLRINVGEGQPFTASEARRLGCSSALLSYHEKRGNFRRLGRGVFAFPEDELNLFYSLAFLQRSVPDLHIGAESALDYHATQSAHSLEKRLVLCTQSRKELPSWFREKFSVTHVRRTAFLVNDDSYRKAIDVVPVGASKIFIANPALAFVEILNDVGVRLPLNAARGVLAKAGKIGRDDLTRLLKATPRVKVRGLSLKLSQELDMPFADVLRRELEPFQRHARWTRKCRDGERLDLKA